MKEVNDRKILGMSGRTRLTVLGALVVTLLVGGFIATSYFLPQYASAWPTKYSSCTSSGCHVLVDSSATIAVAINGAAGTTVTVAAGGSFQIDWIATNATNAASYVGLGLEIAVPTGWTVAKGTANSPALAGWNSVWDNTDGVAAGWATANMFSTAAVFASSPDGYTINFDGTSWDTGTRNAAYDNGSAGDLDGVADKMGTDAIVTVPGGASPGTYQVVVVGVGHDTAKSHVKQTITVTVSGGADTTKPTVTGFTATTPSTSRTIPVTAFTASDNVAVTGYLITTSATPPLAGDAGWTGTAPASYTVGSDGSFTLYPWAKDAAGNVSLVYGSPATVLVDTVIPGVSTTVPANGATGVAVNGTVTLNFSENIDCATVTTATVTIAPAVTWNQTSCSGTQAVFTPAGQANSTSYTVTAGTGVKDPAGNALAAPYPFSYTTAAAVTPPDTTISAPTDSAVLTTSPYSITGTAVAGTNPLASVQVSTNNGSSWSSAVGTTGWSYSWTLPAEDYVAHTILAKGVDNAANEDPTPASVTIRVDNVPPAGLNNSSPANGGTNLATTTSLGSTTATDGNISGALQYFFEVATDAGFTAGLQQSGWQTGTGFAPTLAGSTTYYWHVKARDAAANSTAYTTTWSFTTIGPTPPDAPTPLQYKTDGVTAIAQGGTTNESSVVIKATVTDPNNDSVTLEVEFITNGNSFAGVATCSSAAVASGSVATATCGGLTDLISYKWRARTNDGSLQSSWADFGGSDPDVTVTLPNSTPAVPAALAQYEGDGVTPIASGGSAATNTVVIGAQVDGGNGDAVLLEVDLNGDSIADCASGYVTGPATAKATCSGLADASYNWQVRAKDRSQVASAWTAFAGTPDFTVATGLDVGVDTTPPTDGTASGNSGDGYINLTWTTASDGTGSGLDPLNTYKVVKATGATAPADCSGAALYAGNGTAYLDTAVINGTTYSYRVCALDKVGNISAGTTASASPSAIALPDTAITAPAGGATLTASPYSITGSATVGANPLASVQVSTNNGSTWSTATGTTSWSYSWTLPAEDYVAHTILAKAEDTLAYADPTPASVTIRVDNVAPAGLANSSPANGATAVVTTSAITSATATDGNTSAPVQYFFEIATNSGFTTGVQQSGWQTGTSFSPSMNPATTYYWHVQAKDAAGNTSAYTTTWSFTTGVIPPDTTISAPTPATVFSVSPASITGTASAGTNPLGSVQVSTNNGSTWSAATGTTNWSYSWTLPAEDYVAHVIQAKALDNAANPDLTPASVTVYVDTVAPTGVANSSPANGATGVAIGSSVTAAAASDANTTAAIQYFIEVATDSGFTTGLQQSGWQTGTGFAPTMTVSTVYYWHVRARDAAGNVSSFSTTWSYTSAPPTTTVGAGTGETGITIAPGAPATDLDAFTLQTTSGTDTVTSVTVTLAAGTYAGIGTISVTDDAGAVTHGSVTNPSADAVAIPLSTNIGATTSQTQYRVAILPKSHGAMPAPPGASYQVTGTVTAIASGNPKAYNDGGSATVTIDNLSPGNPTSPGGAAGTAQNTVSWTNPADSDFQSVVVLRRAGAAVTDAPVEGTGYAAGNVIGSSTVAYVGAAANFTDAPLVNGTAYYYKIFALDTMVNYSAGGTAAGPFTPSTPWGNNSMLHNSTNTASTKWSANGGWGEPGKKYGAFTCSTCHNMTTANIKRIKTSVATPDGTNWGTSGASSLSAAFLDATPATGTFGADNTSHSSSTKICEVCHSITAQHNYNQASAVAHNGNDCMGCHPHSSGFKGEGGSCLGCHNTVRGVRQPVVGASLGSTGDDFVRPSRHIKNTTVKNVDCVICHAEGDTTTTETSVRQVAQHKNQVVKLRNVDNQANPGTAGTNYWSWPGRRNGGTTITSADRDNMDRFCVNCHDSDGALTIAVNAAGTGIDTGASVARKTTPFNPLDGGTALNVKSQFNSGNAVGSAYASHHNLNIYTKRYTAAYATTYASRGGWTGTSMDGVAMKWDTGLHCSDCHLNESNAHGARYATRMLRDKNGADAAATNNSNGSATFVCYRCHLSTVYNNSNVTVTGKARIEHDSLDNVPFTAGTYGDRGIVCMNCHSGGSVGAIHGNNRSITTTSQGATKAYRFMYGNELGYNISEANWATTVQPTCYTSGSTWGGSCTKHNGATTESGRIGGPTYSRPLQ